MAEKSYKQLRQELDQLFDELDSDEVDIDEAFKKYEQGIKLVKQLEAKLKLAENKIKKIDA